MNIKQLKYANALVTEESFSLAARACFVSQPTLSNSINALEQEFGQLIFNRTTRKVELSDFGRDLLPFIHAVLNAENSLLEHIDITNKTEDNIIRIGISPMIDSKMIMPVIEAYKCTYKHSKIIVNEINLNELNQQLSNQLLDVIFIPRVPNLFLDNEYDSLLLYQEPLHVVMKCDSSFSDTVELKDLQNETLLMLQNRCSLSAITRDLLESSGHMFKEYEGKALSCSILSEWACSGVGIAILPESKIPDTLEHSARLYQGTESIDLSFDVKWKKSNEITKPFMEFIKKYFENVSSF